MNIEMIIGIGKDTVMTTIYMAAPMLLTGALIGIVISMVQTVTQLKDQSITFIPKIFGVLLVAIFATPFLLQTIVNFTLRLYRLAETLGKGI